MKNPLIFGESGESQQAPLLTFSAAKIAAKHGGNLSKMSGGYGLLNSSPPVVGVHVRC